MMPRWRTPYEEDDKELEEDYGDDGEILEPEEDDYEGDDYEDD